MPSKVQKLSHAVLAVTLVGAAVRLATMGYFSFSADELATLKWSLQPAGKMLETFGQGATSHLYDLAMKVWIGLFGASPVLTKLPSLATGILTIPLLYVIGRRWLSPTVAVLAATMAALSKPMIIYARTARPYAILTLLALASMAVFLRATRTGQRKHLLLLTLLNTLLLTTSLNAAYVLLVQGILVCMHMFLEPRLSRRRVLELGASFAVTGVLAVGFYFRMLDSIFGIGQAHVARFYRPSLLLETFTYNHPSGTWLLLGFLLVGSVLAWRRRALAPRLLVLWAVVPPCFYVLSKISYPVPSVARYLVPTLPAHFLLTSFGLMATVAFVFRHLSVPSRPTLPVAWLLAIAAMMWNLSVWHPAAKASIFNEQKPTGPAMERIREIYRPGDIVTFDLESRYYWLCAHQENLTCIGTRSLARRPDADQPGRLLVLTYFRPEAKPWWARHFRVETLDGERFREQLFLLVSDPFPAGAGVLRAPVRKYLQGYVEAAEAVSELDGWKASRQYLVLAPVHQLLAELASDGAERRRHQQLAQEYRQLSTRAMKTVGAD